MNQAETPYFPHLHLSGNIIRLEDKHHQLFISMHLVAKYQEQTKTHINSHLLLLKIMLKSTAKWDENVTDFPF